MQDSLDIEFSFGFADRAFRLLKLDGKRARSKIVCVCVYA